jgi:hypothetical protein
MSAQSARDITDLVVLAYRCPGCGKVCYRGRKAAKRAGRRLYPGKHMRAYRCDRWWHLTSRLERAKARYAPAPAAVAAATADV